MKVFLFLCLLQAALRLATMDVHCLLTFRHLSKVGFVYSVTGFDVIRANQNFKQSDYPLSIWYNDSTVFDEITEPLSPIPVERFRFRNHDELLCLDNTNTHLPDVIGELTSIKDTVSYPPQEKDLAWQPSKSSSNNLFQLGIY